MKILQQLSEAMGVSGAEGEVRRAVLGLIEKHVDDIHTDTMGNLIVRKKGTGKSKFTVMVDAHMDEVGMMVNGYDSNGMLRVVAVGGLDDRILVGKRVLVGPDRIPGAIGVKPIHITDSEERDKAIKLENLRVDIGVDSKGAAEGKAPLGTRVGFVAEFGDHGALLRGKAFDDRVGCAVLVHLLQGKRFPFDLVGSFTVQEEVGSRGAKVAAHRVNPDLAIVLEAAPANDLPRNGDTSPVAELGKGPAFSLMDRSTIYDSRLNRWLIDSADAAKIPYQFRQPTASGGTNGASIHLSQDGIPVAVLYVPCRYIHTPASLLHKQDYQNAIKLAQTALARLDPKILKR